MNWQSIRFEVVQRLSWIGLGLLALTCGPGCGNSVEETKVKGQVGQNLETLSKAYAAATEKNGRPPSGPDELKPFLPPNAEPDAVFRSARDGQPFVILWGADPRTGMDLKPLVIAYEKDGKGGSRFVYTAMGIMQMTNEDFAQANFPAGRKPEVK